MRFFLAGVLLCGCAVQGEECDLRPGAYRIIITEVFGTCGPLTQPDTVLDEGRGPPGPGYSDECTGPVDFTADYCTVEMDRLCPDEIGTVRYTGAVTIVGPDRAEGTVRMVLSERCVSTYELTWVRR